MLVDTVVGMNHDEVDWVPENLERVAPGYVLAAMLDDIDLNTCSGYDRIRVLRARQRMVSHYQAQTYQAMTSVVDAMRSDPDETDLAEEAAAAEIGAALHLTRRASDGELAFALELQRRLPRVWDALRKGTIDLRRARIIVDNTLHLTVAGARDVVDTIINDAGQITTGQLGAKLRKLCVDRDPEDARERYRSALDDRRLVSEPDVSGTANLVGLGLPPERVTAITTAINEIAKQLHSTDSRTMDQLRADTYLDALEAGIAMHPKHRGKRGAINLSVTLASLAELSEAPGELAGYGPVIADVARQVAQRQQNAEWSWTLVDPDTGLPIDGETTRRRPTAAQRRFVETHYPHCAHPGCRMPAADCDVDHRTTWAERKVTCTDNLAPLCRHHHRIRHQHGWRYEALPDGDFKWTTKLGHTYTTSGQSP